MSRSTQPEIPNLTRVQVLLAMMVTAIILLAIAKVWIRLGRVPLLPIYWDLQVLWWGLGISAFITLASATLYRFWPGYRQSAQYYVEMVLRPLLWWDLIWVGLLPGMSEELLFRGVMLPALGLTPVGVAISSACFGALHLGGPKPWPYVVWATIVGFILGTSAIVTGNLLVPVVAHAIVNWISGSLWKWGQHGKVV